MNQRPSGYEPDELPNCSIPLHFIVLLDTAFILYHIANLLSREILKNMAVIRFLKVFKCSFKLMTALN